MKAIYQKDYGGVDTLELREVEKPRPNHDEVLIKVCAASVHPDVWHVVCGRPFALRLMGAGYRRPKNPIPGTDVAGIVESVGKNATRFRVGDQVFGETIGASQWTNGGAYAEYVAVKETSLALKPARITFEQAATVPTAGSIVLFNLGQAGEIIPGQKILVNGAGGGVGSLAVQIAKAKGALVTGVDCASKLEMVRELGASNVIDYEVEDYTQRGELYDLIFDIPGNHPFSRCRQALSPRGKYILIGHEQFGSTGHLAFGILPTFFKLMMLSVFVKQLPPVSFSMPSKTELMETLREHLEAGEITPRIDSSFPLDETPRAIRHLTSGTAVGRIVITCSPEITEN